MKQNTPVKKGGRRTAELLVFFRLQRAARLAQLEADRALVEAAGVTVAQAAVLSIVASGTSVSQRDVARRLGLHESAVTAVVSRLERAGAMVRGRDPGDARQWRLVLTPQGQRALEQARGPFEAINQRIGSALGPQGVESFAEHLNAVAAAFGAGASAAGAGAVLRSV